MTRKIIPCRIYDDALKGYRVLVDRLWPRGVSKNHAALDEWCKEISPSPALRTWYGHDPEKWPVFRRKYAAELKQNADAAHALLARAGRKPLILLYGAKDSEHSHALALKDFLEGLE